MLGDLIAGYGSDSSDGSEGKAAVEKKEEVKKAEEVKKEEPPAKPKRKLPSASAMMAATTSWAPGTQESSSAEPETDKLGTKYNHVAPPQGVRAEDGVMGGGGDYIKPILGHSLDEKKVFEGKRTLGGSGLVPRQVGGKKNVSTEDTGSWTTDKKQKGKR